MQSRLKEQYEKKVVPELQKKFKYKNIMMVPKLEKISLSMGVGQAITDKKKIESVKLEMG